MGDPVTNLTREGQAILRDEERRCEACPEPDNTLNVAHIIQFEHFDDPGTVATVSLHVWCVSDWLLDRAIPGPDTGY